MGTYYAAVEAFDPEGQALMEDDGIYGGEARFFVLEAEDLFEALSTLSNSITVNGLRLTRILHAGSVEDFDDEMLPFEVEIDEMVEVALDSGEICVSDAHVFEPDEAEGAATGVFAVCVDAFDPDWAEEDEDGYAGHYQLVVIKAATADEALQTLVEEFSGEGILILALEGLVDTAAFPFDSYEFEFEDEDPVGEVKATGGMILSNAYAYAPEAEEEVRKLDS